MRNGFVGAVGVMLASASFAFSQNLYYGMPYPYQPATPSYYNPAPGYYGYGYGYGYAPGYTPAYGMQPVRYNEGPAPANWNNNAPPAVASEREMLHAPIADAPAFGAAPQVESNPPSLPIQSAPSLGTEHDDSSALMLPTGEGHSFDAGAGHAAGVTDGYAGHGPGCGLCVWASGELLVWQIKDPTLNAPLLTEGRVTDPIPGALGQPGTTVVSPSSFPMNYIPGGRLDVGGWLSAEHKIGLEASGFFLSAESKSFSATSPTSPNTILAVPAFLQPAGTEGVLYFSFPGFTTLDATITTHTQFYGGEANFLFHVFSNECWSVGSLVGVRALELDEKLSFSTDTNILPAAPAQIVTSDQWSARNTFYGGQVGLKAETHWNIFFANVLGKIAVGDMHEQLNRNGTTTATGNVLVPGTFTGGIFNLVTNIGNQTKEQFGVVPEIQAQLGVELSRHLRLFVGYDFLYVNTVIRPGDQIDRNVNVFAVPPIAPGTAITPVQPIALFNPTSFWAQGINAGVEVRY
jgi:hypothetical protein